MVEYIDQLRDIWHSAFFEANLWESNTYYFVGFRKLFERLNERNLCNKTCVLYFSSFRKKTSPRCLEIGWRWHYSRAYCKENQELQVINKIYKNWALHTQFLVSEFLRLGVKMLEKTIIWKSMAKLSQNQSINCTCKKIPVLVIWILWYNILCNTIITNYCLGTAVLNLRTAFLLFKTASLKLRTALPM